MVLELSLIHISTLDSMWASAAYVQTLVEASSAQINISRFRQKGPSNLWAGRCV